MVPNRSSPRVLHVHPGTQHSKYLIEQLYRNSLLFKARVGLSAVEGSLLEKLFLHKYPLRVIHRVPHSSLSSYPWSFFRAKLLQKIKKLSNEEYCFAWFEHFQKRIPDSLIAEADIVIGYDTASWILAERVKYHGKIFILDHSAVPHVSLGRLMSDAYGGNPQVQSDIPTHSEEMLRCFQKERDMADYIVHASTFTGRCLEEAGVSKTNMRRIPYGVQQRFAIDRPRRQAMKPVRFVFVGGITLGKGVPFLVDAFKGVESSSELHLCGWGSLSNDGLFDDPQIFLHGVVPHTNMPKVLAEMDVLVLPSIVEGFGLVVLEAMQSGMPVIVSDQVGAADVVVDGESGFVVHAGDVDSLADSMRYFVDNPERIAPMGEKAKSTAEKLSWERYGKEWSDFLRSID